jgi:hypothetical protein
MLIPRVNKIEHILMAMLMQGTLVLNQGRVQVLKRQLEFSCKDLREVLK